MATHLPVPLRTVTCWSREHPLAPDGLLAGLVLVCMVAGSFADRHGTGNEIGPTWDAHPPGTLSLILMIAGAAALVLRRRLPLPVLGVTSVCASVELVTGEPRAPVVMSAVIALYTVAAHTDRSTAWRVGLVTVVGLTAVGMLCGELPWYAQENLVIMAWTGLAAAFGDAVRSRRAFFAAIRERADRAERTREEEARRRVAEERLRIARDLHDVVAHHIALVNVQAGVAAHVMDKRPDQAKEALAHVRQASRSALDELRATVGLLRQSGDPAAPTEPTAGLDRLEELLDTFRSAGLPVRLVTPDPLAGRAVPAAVDLAAYRVVQEALTNVQKHAGPGAGAEISVVRVGRQMEVTVLDDGLGGAAEGPEDDGGHGLLGMRERVTALGGGLTAAPRYGGGFRVHAILPLELPAPGRDEESRPDERLPVPTDAVPTTDPVPTGPAPTDAALTDAAPTDPAPTGPVPTHPRRPGTAV